MTYVRPSKEKTEFSSIYALVSPISGKVRYVGKTKCKLKLRLQLHISEARSLKPGRKNSWVRKLLEKDLEPKILLIEESMNGDDSEEKWILHYREILGTKLLNAREGRTTSHLLPEVRQKMKEYWRKRGGTFLGRKHTPEALENIRKARKNLKENGPLKARPNRYNQDAIAFLKRNIYKRNLDKKISIKFKIPNQPGRKPRHRYANVKWQEMIGCW